jgi:hypothetical protein
MFVSTENCTLDTLLLSIAILLDNGKASSKVEQAKSDKERRIAIQLADIVTFFVVARAAGGCEMKISLKRFSLRLFNQQ